MDVQKQRGCVYRARLDATGVSIILLFLAFPYIFLHLSAAGNPDPEKIGAFGVGG